MVSVQAIAETERMTAASVNSRSACIQNRLTDFFSFRGAPYWFNQKRHSVADLGTIWRDLSLHDAEKSDTCSPRVWSTRGGQKECHAQPAISAPPHLAGMPRSGGPNHLELVRDAKWTCHLKPGTV